MADFDFETIQRITELTDRCHRAESDRDALSAHQKALVFELSACQGVLHSLAHSGQVTREYADEAKAVLKRSPEASLTRLKDEWQAEVLKRVASRLWRKSESHEEGPYRAGFADSAKIVEMEADRLARQTKGGDS